MLRLVDSGLCHPLYSVAIEEALLESCSKGLMPPTLHLYVRDRPTVSLGYFEKVETAIDPQVLLDEDVFLVRRMSGGSTIFTDQGQLIFSLTIDQGAIPNPEDAYALTCGVVVNALESLGVKAEHKLPNDILVNGKKISGSAQTRKKGMLMVHGTLLVDTDLDRMMRVLRPKNDKRSRNREQMTCLRDELDRSPDMNQVKDALVQAFSNELEQRAVCIPVNEREKGRVKALIEEKYGKEDFILQF
ncbi:MAG TPA: biotin/lipoate A/B protein ligase family protein [Methanomassiliicoccales archaeon]|nr:biotin/lipoate A/B protein ligase family protein [Methanomassiliicoccales archaeon]HPR97709.1 biotin/lipoate A/B protein ligase family protein [Methanomassiliicoccales archaeon]